MKFPALILNPKCPVQTFLAVLILALLVLASYKNLPNSGSIKLFKTQSTPSLQSDSCSYFNSTNKRFKYKLDLRKRINHHPSMFQVLAEPSIICDRSSSSHRNQIDFIAYVYTRLDDFEKRQIVRQTWANRTRFPSFYAIFVLGSSLVRNNSLETCLQNETETHGDILRGSFADRYHNLTLKSTLAWQWMNGNCQLKTGLVKRVMKIDDDVVVNTRLLLDQLRSGELARLEKGRSSICRVLYDSPIIRDASSRFYVSFEEYPWERSVYEPYCAGAWLVFSADLAPLLYEQAWRNAGYMHDDVYMGMLTTCVSGHVFEDRRQWQCEDYASHANKTSLKLFTFVLYMNDKDQYLQAWDFMNT
jgi:hypothetical protein